MSKKDRASMNSLNLEKKTFSLFRTYLIWVRTTSNVSATKLCLYSEQLMQEMRADELIG